MDQDTDIRDIRSVASINFLLGVWLMVSPWIFNYSTSQAKWNQFAFGLAVLVLSAIRFFVPSQIWASWMNMIAGLWMVIAPFILNYSTSAAYWNEIIVGIAVTLLALSNLNTFHPHRTHGSPA